MKKSIHLLLIILLGVFLVFWTGCGSSKKTMNEGDSSTSGQSSSDDYDEIEKLLGINRDDKKSEKPAQKPAEKSTSQTKSNDDLITLLEVNEGKQKETPAEAGTQVEDKRVARLQADVEDLRKDLKCQKTNGCHFSNGCRLLSISTTEIFAKYIHPAGSYQ